MRSRRLRASADAAPRIERATAEDLTSLVTDVGPAPMQVGAVLVLDASGGLDLNALVEVIGERIRGVPRLRQRLVPVPFGCGRPVWVDDTAFSIHAHVRAIPCPAPGDDAALLDLAAERFVEPLRRNRPLWSMTLVPGVDGDRVGLIIVFHHVLADGIGGLAVLASLVDGLPPPDLPPFPRPAPATTAIAGDALRERVATLAHLPDVARRLAAAFAELRSARPGRPDRSSLNRPTGGSRRFAVVRVPLADVRSAAHAGSATVNDVVLAAVGAALHRLLAGRGEAVDRFVVSVPVSARRSTTSSDLGNQVGVVPVEVPATGAVADRLAAIAATTRAAKETPRGASSAVVGPVFRVLARLGLFERFIGRQRYVSTFVTNLRGPAEPLAVGGAPIIDLVPIAMVTGNVTVAFTVLSYAGTLTIAVVADPEACPDLDRLRTALDEELHRVLQAASPDGRAIS